MPKSYSQFKYADLKGLHLSVILDDKMFHDIDTLQPSAFLTQLLEINSAQPLATEKAKSEFIIAPILYEIARKNKNTVSFYSGHGLDVDSEKGLKGFCDFLFTKSPKTPIVEDPIFCIVEAKNDNPDNGIAQCIAEMYGARLFNERNGRPTPTVYGCVTTGRLWVFLILKDNIALQDVTIYSIQDLPKILGILQHIVDK